MPSAYWEKFVGDGYVTMFVRHDHRTNFDEGNEDYRRADTWSAHHSQTLAHCLCAVPLCIPIYEALEELADMRCETSNQHSLHKNHAE